jgi:hypothetical protein
MQSGKTGVGKRLTRIAWSQIPPGKTALPADLLGSLVICLFSFAATQE